MPSPLIEPIVVFPKRFRYTMPSISTDFGTKQALHYSVVSSRSRYWNFDNRDFVFVLGN